MSNLFLYEIYFFCNPTKTIRRYIYTGNRRLCRLICSKSIVIKKGQIHIAEIVHTSTLVNGEPRLSGRLLSVKDIVNTIQCSDSLHEVVDEYHITLSQIRQALQYCSGQYCKQDKPKEFCSTCSLCKEQKGPLNISGLEEVTFNNTTYVRGNNSLFLGTMNELPGRLEWKKLVGNCDGFVN